jgi:type III pantothenate kinase
MTGYILGIDIGNTNTVFGLFRADSSKDILHHWRTATHKDRTSDELAVFLISFLGTVGVRPADISGLIYSSVVPSFNTIVERMASDYFSLEPQRVRYDAIPLRITYPRPFEIGADRLVNAVASSEIYGGDQIIVDLGTATTFCILHGREYLGGVIAPGLNLSIKALKENTAQLPTIEFKKPLSGVIGDSTVHALQSGFFFGWVGILREIIREIRNTSPERSYCVIGTGGFSSMIQQETELFDSVDPMLTLKGLKLIFAYINQR